MRNLQVMQNVVNYIEENLQSEICVEELAGQAGYSTHHFYRIFNDFIGMPVVQYINKRKLIHAIFAISKGMKIIDAALLYGFNTHGGFFKAFRKEYGCSPRKYINNINIPEPRKIDLEKEYINMLSNKEIKALLSHWDLPNPINISNAYVTILDLKSKNTWLIDEKYILKAEKDLNKLNQNIILSYELQKSGFKSACAIPLKNEEKHLKKDDTYYYLVPYHLDKKLELNCIFGESSSKLAQNIGESIGELQSVLKRIDTTSQYVKKDLYKTVCNWAIPEVKKTIGIWSNPLPESFFKTYVEEFGKLCLELPYQLIHRDPNIYNLIVEENEIIGFAEFQLSEFNVRIFDPCYFGTSLLLECIGDKEKSEKWIKVFNNVLLGYNKVYSLTKEEIDSILYVLYSIQLICISYFESHPEYKKLAEPNKKALAFIYENHNSIGLKRNNV